MIVIPILKLEYITNTLEVPMGKISNETRKHS